VSPALPGTAWNTRLKESHGFTCLLLAKADMRVLRIKHMIRPLDTAVCLGFTLASTLVVEFLGRSAVSGCGGV
jgi:hypothetical protein